ncbi:MAG: hypothetical protein IH606_01605 [Burkholderiales bacterium]|nr:hypothetical protein [Burkholderiales bacterium]
MRLVIALAAALTLLTTPAMAQWKPSGPIKMMISFSPGGTADTLARLIGEEMEARAGWKVIPETVAGKGGNVLAAKLKNEPADGTSIGLITDQIGYAVLAEKDPGFAPGDFAYLTTVAGTQTGLVAKASKGWKTLADVVKDAKGGKKLVVGALSPMYADALYLLGKHLKVNFNIVNFKGGNSVQNAILAGDIDMGFLAGVQRRGVESGTLVNIVSGERSRLKMTPDAPTLSESGFPVDLGARFLFAAPKALKPEAKQALTKLIVDIVQDPKSKAHGFITKSLGDPVVIQGADLDKLIADSFAQAKMLLSKEGAN